MSQHQLPTRVVRKGRALQRARARRSSGGAVIFIVAMTLGVLAAIGVYGLSAATADIRSAGHMREALQLQKAGEASFMMAAETLNASLAQGLVAQALATTGQGQSSNCKTAAPYTGIVERRAAEACLRLDPAEMTTLALGVNPWVAAPYTDKSFGEAKNLPIAPPYGPFVTVEVTNPVDMVVPGNSSQKFAQVTTTVFVQLKPLAGVPADAMVAGRGRLTVGPIVGAASQF